MRFSTFAVAAFVALPSIASAFSLYDVSSDLGDANTKCASQYSIPLMSCARLPASCSDACKEQLRSLEKTLQGVCKGTTSTSLLGVALNNKLVETLCTNDNSHSTLTRPTSSSPTFISGPGKIASVIDASSVAVAAPVTATGLVIDTAVPGPATQPAISTGVTYAPTTLASSTSVNPTTTSASNSNSNSNGSPFSSQDGNSGGAIVRTSALGLMVGILALVANIA